MNETNEIDRKLSIFKNGTFLLTLTYIIILNSENINKYLFLDLNFVVVYD